MDYVIHMGDVTCGGGTYEMQLDAFRAALHRAHCVFDKLPMPAYVLPGNHDSLPGGDWAYFDQLWGISPGIGHTIDLPMARLVLLNAQGHSPAQLQASLPDDPVTGWVNDQELARLDEALATAGGRPVVLFMHQVLLPWQSDQPWKHFYGVENASAVLDLLAAYANTAAVFQGHAHRLNVQTVDLGQRPCTFVIAPSLIEYPLAWLLLDFSQKEIHVQMRRLHLDDLAEESRLSGAGQSWRAGKPAWQDFFIDLL
ncbi:MAG: hypothetical protein HC802_03690 [Caldilineaceae bacterium]|nr:hypothetical protein [Caldilineaceae bacterium]